jgi:hypothetical protein
VRVKVPVFLAALLTLVALAGLGQAHAHVSSQVDAVAVAAEVSPDVELNLVAAPAVRGLPWPAVLAAGVLGLLAARRPRRALALGLSLIVMVFLFETGVHSVHHLSTRGHADHCVLAAASGHVTGVDADPPGDTAPPLQPSGEIALFVESPAIDHHARPDQGRAPPALPA